MLLISYDSIAQRVLSVRLHPKPLSGWEELDLRENFQVIDNVLIMEMSWTTD